MVKGRKTTLCDICCSLLLFEQFSRKKVSAQVESFEAGCSTFDAREWLSLTGVETQVGNWGLSRSRLSLVPQLMQGGRGWLAFVDRNRIPQSFQRTRICKFSRQKRCFLQLWENRPFVVVKRLTHTQARSLKHPF